MSYPMSDRLLYHITSTEAWHLAQSSGKYEPPQFSTEGFIHCSYAEQLDAVRERFFRGQKNLVVLEINPAAVNCEVIEENLEGGSELYPHIYGKLSLAAVVNCRRL